MLAQHTRGLEGYGIQLALALAQSKQKRGRSVREARGMDWYSSTIASDFTSSAVQLFKLGCATKVLTSQRNRDQLIPTHQPSLEAYGWEGYSA